MTKPNKPQSSRVTKVQVPGETPPAASETVQPAPPIVDAKPETTMADVGLAETKLPDSEAGQAASDLALREQIRAELLAELQTELKTATAAVEGKGANVRKFANSAPRNYRDMRAADIDPTTLTAPVLTLDGYLCPITPEKK